MVFQPREGTRAAHGEQEEEHDPKGPDSQARRGGSAEEVPVHRLVRSNVI